MRNHLLNPWPFDEAHMIQQFHNWKSGYPKVTMQPFSLAGPTGEKPFQDPHAILIYDFYKIFYWIWPYPETLIILYSLLCSLSVLTLWYFMTSLEIELSAAGILILSWLFYPLQLRISSYSFVQQMSFCSTFYFLYLALLNRNSKYAFLGALTLILPREEPAFLIPATIILLPKKWKTLLLHFAGLLIFLKAIKISKTVPAGLMLLNLKELANYSFYANFISTQPLLWIVALANPAALLIAAAFGVTVLLMNSPIHFHFPFAFAGGKSAGYLSPVAPFHFYALLMGPMMAAVALGLSKSPAARRRWLCGLAAILMGGPGIFYALDKLKYLKADEEARQILRFVKNEISERDVVVTNYALSCLVANRDQSYVYNQPPKGVSIPEIFTRATVAVLGRPLEPPVKNAWKLAMQTAHYSFFKK